MKLFWRIFFSFWLATILMIAVVLSVNEVLTQMFPENHKHYAPELIASDLTKAVNVYEQQGTAVFISALKSRMEHNSFFLFDEKGNLLAKDGAPLPFYAQMAEEALQSGYAEVHRLAFRLLFVCPVQSAKGRRYAVILSCLWTDKPDAQAEFLVQSGDSYVSSGPGLYGSFVLPHSSNHQIASDRATFDGR